VSTYWFVNCETCHEKCGDLWGNHQSEGAARIVAAAPKLALVPGLRVNTYVSFGFCDDHGEPGSYVDTDWFVKHAGHKIVAKSQYGEIDGTCAERADCPTCGNRGYCKLDRGHENDHVPGGY
jgi:hypothetical protein